MSRPGRCFLSPHIWQTRRFWLALIPIGASAAALTLIGLPIGVVALICAGLLVVYVCTYEYLRAKAHRRVVSWKMHSAAREHRRAVSRKVIGGTNLYEKRAQMVPVALSFVALGGVCFAMKTATYLMPLIAQRLVGTILAVIGIVLLASVFSGRRARMFIRFEATGFFMGFGTHQLRVEWDNIVDIGVLEHTGIQLVGLRCANLRTIDIAPSSSHEDALNNILSNRARTGVDIFLNADLYGIETSALVAALSRYAKYPNTRPELALRRPAHAHE